MIQIRRQVKFLAASGLCLFLESASAFARAGGGGGGHSSSSSHSSGSYSSVGHSSAGSFNRGSNYQSYQGSYNGPGTALFSLIFFLVIVIFIVLVIKAIRDGKLNLTIDQIEPKPDLPIRQADLSALQGEDVQKLKAKITTAFLTVQQAWTLKRLDEMRRFISDGVYQRFHAQFVMMDVLKQSNPMTGVEVQQLQIVQARREGLYLCVDVAIRASANDKFVCELFPNLNSPGGQETFTEYWTFMKKASSPANIDIFHSENCPQCGAPLGQKLTSSAVCPFCGCYVNNGDYDWVLSEITQAEDFGNHGGWGVNLGSSPYPEILARYPDFSPHKVTDCATNAFMQILIATARRDMQSLKRFIASEKFESFSAKLPRQNLVYDRLYSRNVELLSVRISENTVRAWVGIRFSAHVIDMAVANRALAAPDQMPAEVVVVQMMRIGNTQATKGSIYAGTCPHCGAAQKDSLNPACIYCGIALNDPRFDWVVEGLLSVAELRSLFRVAV